MERFKENFSKQSESTSERKESPKNKFEKIYGYNLEVFSSKEEMYNRMEEIRKENSHEAYGFTKEDKGKIGFYYKISEKKTSTEIDHETDNSWHSHPDIAKNEIVFSDKLPSDCSKDIKEMRQKFFKICDEIDESSPKKPSVTDILTFISGKRKGDLISIPGGLLEINSKKSVETKLLKKYTDRLEKDIGNLGRKLWRALEDLEGFEFHIKPYCIGITKSNARKWCEVEPLVIEVLEKHLGVFLLSREWLHKRFFFWLRRNFFQPLLPFLYK